MSSDKNHGSRGHDIAPANALNEFMATGWAATPLAALSAAPSVAYAASRRKKLSANHPGETLVIHAGG